MWVMEERDRNRLYLIEPQLVFFNKNFYSEVSNAYYNKSDFSCKNSTAFNNKPLICLTISCATVFKDRVGRRVDLEP